MCRCNMCGWKQAGKQRGGYFRAGVKCNEDPLRFQGKRSMRRLRRVRENRVWKASLDLL